MPDMLSAPAASAEALREEIERLRLLHSISLEFSASLDFDELLPRVFQRVLAALGAEGGSLWIADGDILRCRLAEGGAGQKLVGAQVPVGTGFIGDVAQRPRTTIVTRAVEDPRYEPRVDSAEMLATTVMATAMVAGGVTVGAIQVSNKLTGDGVFDERDRELLEGLASSAAAALRNAQLHTVEKRARDLALLLEISREITATLDLDRVLRSVVNLASKALQLRSRRRRLVREGPLRDPGGRGPGEGGPQGSQAPGSDRPGGVGGGPWRAALPVGPDRPRIRCRAHVRHHLRCGPRGRWGRERALPPAQGRRGRARRAGVRGRPNRILPAPVQLEVAAILANQTAVALRNAQLYHQVPMVDALGAAGREEAGAAGRPPPEAAALWWCRTRRWLPQRSSFGGRFGWSVTSRSSGRWRWHRCGRWFPE